MSTVVCDISVSADGYSAGHNQTEEHPFGDGDTSMLHAWAFDTPKENQAEVEAITNAKAFIMGRNMFGRAHGLRRRRAPERRPAAPAHGSQHSLAVPGH